MECIKFNKNWNNKLDNNVFTTIRKFSHSKYDYFAEHLNDEFGIYLKGSDHRFHHYCCARLVRIEMGQLRGLSKSELMVDAGLSSPAMIFELFQREFGIEDTDYILYLTFERRLCEYD